MAAQEALRWRYGDVDDSNFAVRGRGVPVLVALFGVLVCFVAVCLYLRWACHRYYYYNDRSRNGDDSSAALPRYWASSSTPGTSSSSSLAPPPPLGSAASVPAGLDDAAIAGLPVTLYRRAAGRGAGTADDDAAAQCCPICLGELVDGDKVKALPGCGHGFHPECVDAWLRARASCPLCRASLLAAAAATKPPGDDGVIGSDEAAV